MKHPPSRINRINENEARLRIITSQMKYPANRINRIGQNEYKIKDNYIQQSIFIIIIIWYNFSLL